MRALLVIAIVLLAAATAFAYGPSEVTNGFSTVVAQTSDVVFTEPVMLLLSGALLMVLGGAVRRYSL